MKVGIGHRLARNLDDVAFSRGQPDPDALFCFSLRGVPERGAVLVSGFLPRSLSTWSTSTPG